MSDIEKLKEIPLFKGLSEAMLGEFSGYFRQTTYPAGTVIFKERTTGDSLYIIVEGEVVIEKALDAEGTEFKQLAILGPGEFFGEMAVIEGQMRFAQARAGKDAALYEVERDKFFSFIKEHPQTGISIFTQIMRVTMRRLQHTSSELTMLFDLSRMLVQEHKSPADFLKSVLNEARIYLEGSWNIKGYVWNMFNEEYEEICSKEVFLRQCSQALPARPEEGWNGDTCFTMLVRADGKPKACAVFETNVALTPVEKNSLATIFNTISSIAGSAMVNIEHQAEAAMMLRMKQTKNSI